MRKVFLITGFNNWGKTRIIKDVFDKGSFRRDRLHKLPGTSHEFMVQTNSNDDFHLRGYCDDYNDRIKELKQQKRVPKYIVSAFCPTKEYEARKKNGPKIFNSTDIISELYDDDEVHILLLKYKWCNHAALRPDIIVDFYSLLKNVSVKTIAAKNYSTRLSALSEAIRDHQPDEL